MVFNKIKDFVLKNKAYCVFFVANVLCFCVLCGSLLKMSSLKNYYKNQLGVCASMLESVYLDRENKMEKIMENMSNGIELSDKMYNAIVNNINNLK